MLLVGGEVKVRPAVDAFELLEAHGEIELDVAGRVRVVGELDVVVEPVGVVAKAEGLVPLDPGLLPVLVPLGLGAWGDEELHLHLLELPHAEDELAGDDLVPEGLADLRDAKRQLHAAGLLDVEEVDENALRRLRTE